MKIGIITVAYALAWSTHKMLETALTQLGEHERWVYLFRHSQHEDVKAICDRWADHHRVLDFPYGTNRGLSTSWNEGILEAYGHGCDVVLIVNDDIVFAPGDVDKLAEYAAQHRENYIVTCRGFNHGLGKHDSIGYSCFAINPIALETIGYFDENFTPIYFEDNDYGRRAMLAGLHEGHCDTTQLEHGGSHTIKYASADYKQQHNRTFEANQKYYKAKWGGEPGKETYTTPFNVAWLTGYIGPDSRHAPYPEFNRTDFSIVQF
jgi:GT2 family glycosyltransferase